VVGVRHMSEPPESNRDQKKPAMRRLEEAMEKMSIAELYKLLSDVSAKIRNLK
jgi:hypothetical protein